MWQAMTFEDLREQPEVSPRTFGLAKKSSADFPRGIVNGADQTKPRPSSLEPVMRGAIDLEHHPLGLFSVSAAAVLGGAAFPGRCDPMGAKELADLLTTELDLLMFFELLGQMMIVESSVL